MTAARRRGIGLQERVLGCVAVLVLGSSVSAAWLALQPRSEAQATVFAALVLLAGAAVAAYLWAAFQPLRRLQAIAEKVESGDMQVRAALPERGEAGIIGRALDRLLSRYHAREGEFNLVRDQKDHLDALTRSMSQLASRLAGGDLRPAAAGHLDASVRPIAEDLNLAASRFGVTLYSVTRLATDVAEVSAGIKARADRIVALARSQREEVEWQEMELSAASSAMLEGAELAQQCGQSATAASAALATARPLSLELAGCAQRLGELAARERDALSALRSTLEKLSGVGGMAGQAATQARGLTARARSYGGTARMSGPKLTALAEEVRGVAEHVNETVTYVGGIAEQLREEASAVLSLYEPLHAIVQDVMRLAESSQREIATAQQAADGWAELNQRLLAAIDVQIQVNRRLEDHESLFLDSLKSTGSHLLALAADAERLIGQTMAIGEAASAYRLPEPGAIELRTDEHAA